MRNAILIKFSPRRLFTIKHVFQISSTWRTNEFEFQYPMAEGFQIILPTLTSIFEKKSLLLELTPFTDL